MNMVRGKRKLLESVFKVSVFGMYTKQSLLVSTEWALVSDRRVEYKT